MFSASQMWKKKMRTLSTGDQPNSQAEPGKAEPAATTMVKQTLDTPRTNPAPPAAPTAAPPKPDSAEPPAKPESAEPGSGAGDVFCVDIIEGAPVVSSLQPEAISQ